MSTLFCGNRLGVAMIPTILAVTYSVGLIVNMIISPTLVT